MQTVIHENHFFEIRLFRLWEFYLALLGSSGRLPGRSCGPDGIQNLPKSDPKIGPKTGPIWDPILSRSWTHFGVHFGVQNGAIWGTLFSRFFGVAPEPHSGPILASFWLRPDLSWTHLGPILSPVGLILVPFWPHLGPFGPLLALSWPHLGTMLAHLSCT